MNNTTRAKRAGIWLARAGSIAALTLAAALPGMARAAGSATVTLDGAWYLQAGSVVNRSDDGVLLTSLTYSLGAAREGGAVWERYLSNGLHEQALAGTEAHYSAERWDGLSLATGARMTFAGLDMDRVVSLGSPVVVDGTDLDLVGTSLLGAFVEATFSDGSRGRAWLNGTGWNVDQVLDISGAPPAVPEPSVLALLAAGLALVFVGRRRRRALGAE